MARQRHIVKRQVLELAGAADHLTPRFQEEASRIFRTHLLPIIERHCDDVAGPDALLRIDLLEVDLGRLPLAHFEQALTESFASRFGPQLARAMEGVSKKGGLSFQATSHLEVIATFARQGTYPWWADSSRPGLVLASVRHLSRHEAAALRRLLVTLLGEERSIRRLILALPDLELETMVQVMAAGQEAIAALSREMLAWLTQTSALGALSTSRWRTALWLEALRLAARIQGKSTREAMTFGSELLAQVGVRVGESGSALAARLTADAGAESVEGAPGLKALRNALIRSKAPSFEAMQAEWKAAVDSLAEERHWLADIAGDWGPLFVQSPPDLRMAMLTVARSCRDASSDEIAREFLSLVRSMLEQGGQFRSAIQTVLSRAVAPTSSVPAQVATGLKSAWAVAALARNGTPEPEEPALDLHFAESDVLYVNNAGLVLLWPFLTRCFELLGWLEERQFRDEASRQRAVGLLHYLATEEAVPVEEQLPLNKILCGMAVDDVLDLGPPVTDVERTESANLLTSLIGQATVLRNMSLPGFRGTFLLREGQLGVRDDRFLLRVKRETYDVVLERFPWTVNWVRLPWMTAPLQVEW